MTQLGKRGAQMWRILVVASLRDPAGMNISSHLRRIVELKEQQPPNRCAACWRGTVGEAELVLVHVPEDILYCDGVEKIFDVELVVYASRHSSSANMATLSVHVSGNWGEAEYGGEPRRLSVASPVHVKAALKSLARLKEEYSLSGFTVAQEQTHHGPTVDVPSMFIEIGSSAKEWVNEVAGSIVAEAIMELTVHPPENCINAVGFGGGHYAPKFTEINLNSSIGVGHIASKYYTGMLDENLLQQAIDKTLGGVELFVLDWKGMKGEERGRIISFAESKGIKVMKTKEV